MQVRARDATDQLLQALTAGPALTFIPRWIASDSSPAVPSTGPALPATATQSRLTLMLGERSALLQELGAI